MSGTLIWPPADGPDVHWKLFADLAETAGDREIAVDADPETVEEALDALLADRPGLEDRVRDGGGLADDVTVLRNGETVRDLSTGVGPDDELALFPPVSGG